MHPNSLREATRKAMEREEHKQYTRLSPGRRRTQAYGTWFPLRGRSLPALAEQLLDPDQQPEGSCRTENKRTWARLRPIKGR